MKIIYRGREHSFSDPRRAWSHAWNCYRKERAWRYVIGMANDADWLVEKTVNLFGWN